MPIRLGMNDDDVAITPMVDWSAEVCNVTLRDAPTLFANTVCDSTVVSVEPLSWERFATEQVYHSPEPVRTTHTVGEDQDVRDLIHIYRMDYRIVSSYPATNPATNEEEKSQQVVFTLTGRIGSENRGKNFEVTYGTRSSRSLANPANIISIFQVLMEKAEDKAWQYQREIRVRR